MTRVIGLSLALATSTLLAQEVNELALEQHPFRVYSAFWPNLHNVLWAEAWARRPVSASEPSEAGSLPEPLTGTLSADERAAWDAAVSYYDREMADLHPVFEMGPIRKRLLTVTGELPITGLAPEHRRVLAGAAPVYRTYWWAAHDGANRAWIAETISKVASLSPAVPERLTRLYGTPWFTSALRIEVE